MPGLDIYSNPGFGMQSLTKAVNEMPFVPGQVAKMGIFEPVPSTTTMITVENYKGTLALVPNTPRGGNGNYSKRDTRYVRTFQALHLPLSDRIYADEIQNIRAFGSMTDLQIGMNEIEKRMKRLRASVETTVEYNRINALRGIILDSDGATVLTNLFTEFGITQTVVDFVLGTAGTEMLLKCTAVRDAIQVELGAVGTDDVEVVCLCGGTFFDRFVTHATVKDAYKYYQERGQNENPMREDLRYKGFRFGNITFIKYRGSVSGVSFVAASEGYFFPVNVPDIFVQALAPADYVETANTPGLPLYAKQAMDPMFKKFVEVEVQSNPFAFCTRPGVLVKGTTSN